MTDQIKTTLLCIEDYELFISGDLNEDIHVCLINNPKLELQEFYHYTAALLGFHSVSNKGEFIIEFLGLLDRCSKQNEKILLIIDEAQFVSIDLMDEVRLLANHAGNRNVLSIFFVGSAFAIFGDNFFDIFDHIFMTIQQLTLLFKYFWDNASISFQLLFFLLLLLFHLLSHHVRIHHIRIHKYLIR